MAQKLKRVQGGTVMKEKMMENKKNNESNTKGLEHVRGNIAKTAFQKNQATAPFQGYNFFGTKPKWD